MVGRWSSGFRRSLFFGGCPVEVTGSHDKPKPQLRLATSFGGNRLLKWSQNLFDHIFFEK